MLSDNDEIFLLNFSHKLPGNFLVEVKCLILDVGQFEHSSLKLGMKISVVAYVVYSHCTLYRSCLGMLKGSSSKDKTQSDEFTKTKQKREKAFSEF